MKHGVFIRLAHLVTLSYVTLKPENETKLSFVRRKSDEWVYTWSSDSSLILLRRQILKSAVAHYSRAVLNKLTSLGGGHTVSQAALNTSKHQSFVEPTPSYFNLWQNDHTGT